MSQINKQVIMKTRPVGMPVLENFEIKESPVPEIRHGEVLIQILWLSLDPYMRGRMSTAKSYAASLNEGDVIVGGAVGRVLETKSPEYNKDDIVEGFTLGWQEYAIANPSSIRKVDPSLAPIQTAVGVLGMPGMTAFFGLLHVGKPIAGDTVVVSAASGAVGQLVGQIAKIGGCKVVGIAGGKEKCSFLINTLNFDEAIDYKNENIDKKLKEYCPDGVNVYFDNVGGKITDAVINQLANYARVAVCGVISQYNLTEPESGLRTHRSMLTNQATTEGFLVFQFAQKYHIGMKRIAKWIQEGKIKYKEDVVVGLENAPSAFIGLMNGKNFGKLLIKVTE
ncbi:MAG: NADP-dependent oxidoreductase [Proteobacteria bacterium]|nr:NADP-dependent oxidoreductase [Pseudomonadota bacterium]